MEYIIKYTGDPFVDAGISAIKSWTGKELKEITKDDIIKMIELIVDLYRKTSESGKEKRGWKNSIYTVFGTNSKILHPSIKDNKKAYKELLLGILESNNNNTNEPICSCCGKNKSLIENKKLSIGREIFPLIGGGGYINFFSSGNLGFRICPICILMVQFSPLVMIKMGDKLSLLHSSNIIVIDEFAKEGIKHLRQNIATKSYTGCRDIGYTKSKNALFKITTDLIDTYNEELYENQDNPEVSIRIYSFNNYQNSSDLNTIEYYDLPSNVFAFLSDIKTIGKLRIWNNFIRSVSSYKKTNKDSEEDSERKINNYYNPVIEGLLNETAIIKYFIDYKNKKPRLDWDIVDLYLKGVLNMEQERIDAIKQLGGKLADLIKRYNLKKNLREIEYAKNYYTMLNQLRKIWEKHIASGEKEPLFSFDEFIYMTFSENVYNKWRETRELLIFRIFEILQPTGWFIESGYIKEIEEIIEDEEIEEINQ